MSNESLYPVYCPLTYVGNRNTGNPQTQPAGGAYAEDLLGREYADSGESTGRKEYKFVLCGPDITGASIPIGSTLYYIDDAQLIVTDKVTAAGAYINNVAGFAQVVMKANMKSWIQKKGEISVLADSGTFVAGEQVQPSSTSGTVTPTVVGVAPTYSVLGVAKAASSGSPLKVLINANIQ